MLLVTAATMRSCGTSTISPRLSSVVRSVPTVVPQLAQDRIRLRSHDRGARVAKIGAKAILDRIQDILAYGEITSGGGSCQSAAHLVTDRNLETLAFRRLARSHVNGLVPKVPLRGGTAQCRKSQTPDPMCSAQPRMRSARSRSDGAIVSPRVLAVLMLMMSSNFVGSSTGSSAGVAPLKILSTKPAARRYISVYSTP